MLDAARIINPRTPGFALAFVDNSGESINVIFDKPYSGVGGIESYHPSITCSAEDSVSIKKHSLIEIEGEEKLRATSNPQLDGTGIAHVILEEFYE